MPAWREPARAEAEATRAVVPAEAAVAGRRAAEAEEPTRGAELMGGDRVERAVAAPAVTGSQQSVSNQRGLGVMG